MNEVKPMSLTQLLEITSKIIERHQETGSRSPLNPRVIADLNYKITNARGKHEDGLRYKRMMEQAFAERDRFLLGGDPQDVLDQKVDELCEILREMYKSDKKELEKWGL